MKTTKCSCGCDTCGCDFNPCAVTCGCCVQQSGDYAFIYNTEAQMVACGDEVNFSDNGPMSGIAHAESTENIVICNAGVYKVTFFAAAPDNTQLTANLNGEPIDGATYRSEDMIFGQFIVSAQAGDILTFVNSGNGRITLRSEGACSEKVTNASVTIERLF